MKTSIIRLFAAILVACFASSIRGETIHYDVFVTGSGTSLVIGGYDDDATTATIPAGQMRVFGGEVVGSGSASPYQSASPGEPGFRAVNQGFLNNPALTTPANVYTALPAATPLTFSFLPITIGSDTRNLFYWNGAGSVAFAPVASDVTLDLSKLGGGGWTRGINGASASVISGTSIQDTGSGGTVHTHLFTSIGSAGQAPDQGFYLYSLQLEMTGYTSSDPLYFVFGALDPGAIQAPFGDLDEFETAHGLAEVWVEDNLAVVPEPSSLALAGIGAVGAGLAALRSRQRRSRQKAGKNLA